MSMTATAKLEATSTNGLKAAKKMSTPNTPQFSDVVMAKADAQILSSSETSTCTKTNRISTNRYWWINGRAYDLTNFVNRHPGGVEAILLGKGRDCTALVESYHAFAAPKVWKVLEMFRVTEDGIEQPKQQGRLSKERSNDHTESIVGPKPDIFYDTLKERVTATLLSKGIDPIQNRGASVGRTAYYCFIFALWIYTGYMHLSVSHSLMQGIRSK
jgi:cytochrome b involved in lipid metabolism